jgi:hypothetical protein
MLGSLSVEAPMHMCVHLELRVSAAAANAKVEHDVLFGWMPCRSGDSVVVTARSAHGVRTTVRELQSEMDAGISVKGAILPASLPMWHAHDPVRAGDSTTPSMIVRSSYMIVRSSRKQPV